MRFAVFSSTKGFRKFGRVTMYYIFNCMVVHNMSIVSPKNVQMNSTILNVGGTKTLESALNKIADLI